MSTSLIAAFVAECRAALADKDPTARIAESIRPLIQDAAALSSEVLATGERIAPNALLLHRSPELTVLDVRQKAGHRGVPHNHLMWVVAGVYLGQEDNTMYKPHDGGLAADGETVRLRAPAIAVLPADAWHGTHNPSHEEYAVLQVCGGDFIAATPQRLAWDDAGKRFYPFSEAVARFRASGAFAPDDG